MASQSEEDIQAKEKRDRRNFLRRQSRFDSFVSKRKEVSDTLQTDATNEAQRIVSAAQNQANAMLQNVREECKSAEEKLSSLNKSVAEKEALLADLNRRVNRKKSRTSNQSDAQQPNKKRRTVNSIVTDVVRDLKNRFDKMEYNLVTRQLVLKRFWLHRDMKQYHPSVLGCPKLDASVSTAVADIRASMAKVKFACRKDHLSTKRAVLTTMNGQSTVANRYQSAVARALGIKRHNMYKAGVRRKVIDSDPCIRYPMGDRQVRSDKISSHVQSIVEKFWEENTRISPRKGDIMRKRIGPKQYEQHQKHWLEVTEVEFFFNFQEWCQAEHPQVSLGLRSFQKLKPYFICRMVDRNVCCCREHVEMDLLKEAINKFRKYHHPTDCVCECSACRGLRTEQRAPSCVATKNTITSVQSWMEGALCPKRDGHQWHKRACIMGFCKKCGLKKLEWCSAELDPTLERSIEWEAFEYVELEETAQMRRERKKGTDESAKKKITRLRIVPKVTSMANFRKVTEVKMKTFLVHNFRYRWQSDEFKRCMKVFPRGTIVSQIDFSENYTFKTQNEIQSQHWDNQQITLLVHVTYRHRADVCQTLEAVVGRSVKLAQVDENGDRDIIADYHFYISDDRTHDTLFVQHCLDAHWHWMKEEGIQFKQHWVWSDGAASQFKACRPFYYVSRYYSRFGARMKWFFHASGHGKGVPDALGGHIKTGIEREQLKGTDGYKLENAHDVVQFCRDKFALGQQKEYGDVQLVRRLFWEIEKNAVNRQKKWDCHPIKHTMKLHCFDGFSEEFPVNLRTRELSCFCPSCLDDDEMNCENRVLTGPWKLQIIEGVLPADVRPAVEKMGAGEGGRHWEDGHLAELVRVGDFFAVPAEPENDWGVPFYILQCEESLHSARKSFEDAYGMQVNKDDLVLKGVWFEPVQGTSTRFLLKVDKDRSWCHARQVIQIRFGMTPSASTKGSTTKTYTLDSDTLATIIESCP